MLFEHLSLAQQSSTNPYSYRSYKKEIIFFLSSRRGMRAKMTIYLSSAITDRVTTLKISYYLYWTCQHQYFAKTLEHTFLCDVLGHPV